MAHPFLSDGWMDALRELRDIEPDPPPTFDNLTINLIVTGGPSPETREVHVTEGRLGRGLLDDAATTFTLPYDTAKRLVVDRDLGAGIEAFAAGHLKIVGDMTSIIALQTAAETLTPEQQAYRDKVRSLTI